MKLKISVKMSEDNIAFWKKGNVNAIKAGETDRILSYSDFQEVVVKFFKLNNDIYVDLIKLVGSMEKKNGIK